MAQDDCDSVFAKTARFRCDFPDCKDARDKRDYSSTTMEEHMANHFLSLRPQLKPFIHQYSCSCGQFFATHYHFTVHLYEHRAAHHQPIDVRAQWCSQKFLDAQAHFHSRFLPLYVVYVPFPKKLKLYQGFPVPNRVANNEDTDDYERSRRSSTPGNATPGSFNMSRNASPSPCRGNSSRAQSPYNARVEHSQSFTMPQISAGRWDRGAPPSRDQRDSRSSWESRNARDSSDCRNPRDSRESRETRDPRESRNSRNSRYPADSSDSRQSRHSEYESRQNSYNQSSNHQRQEEYSRGRRSPRGSFTPQSQTNLYTPPVPNPPEPVQQEFSKPFDEKDFLQVFQRRFPCKNIKSSPLPILEMKPKIKISLKLNSNSTPPEDFENSVPIESNDKLLPSTFTSSLSKINTKKRKAPSPAPDRSETRSAYSSSSISQYPELAKKSLSNQLNEFPTPLDSTKDRLSPEQKSIGFTLQSTDSDGITNHAQTEELDSQQMFQEDTAEQQEILLRQNSRSSYMPLRSNTQRHSVPSANLTVDDENKISSFRPKSGRPEKPKLVANPPFMDIVPNQGSREGRRSRSRSATPSRARSRSSSRGPSNRKSPVKLSASDRRQSRSFARQALRNK